MKSSSSIELRRCRPLLGTFVEIAVGSSTENVLLPAVEGAFRVIQQIQNRMSIHDPASELSLLNARAHRESVEVSDELFSTIERGLEMAAASDGAFDFTVGPILAQWNLRPRQARRRQFGTWRDVITGPGQRVRFRQPLALDLGGIAKGLAVDRAVELLQGRGALSGCVNAGGDLRVFGLTTRQIHLRHPTTGQPVGEPIGLTNSALASSAPTFTRRAWRGRTISHLVNPRTREAVTAQISVSVHAAECWQADALTKIVLNAPPEIVEQLLDQHQAQAIVLNA